jgi:hypothetical protein
MRASRMDWRRVFFAQSPVQQTWRQRLAWPQRLAGGGPHTRRLVKGDTVAIAAIVIAKILALFLKETGCAVRR